MTKMEIARDLDALNLTMRDISLSWTDLQTLEDIAANLKIPMKFVWLFNPKAVPIPIKSESNLLRLARRKRVKKSTFLQVLTKFLSRKKFIFHAVLIHIITIVATGSPDDSCVAVDTL